MSIDNHRLHTSIECAEHILMSTQFEIRMNGQDRFINTTERAICQYKENELHTRHYFRKILRD